MEKENPNKRGPKFKEPGAKKVPLRVWAAGNEVEKRGGRGSVQAKLAEAFQALPYEPRENEVFEPRSEVKEGES